MHVLIATAGVLPPQPVAELVSQLIGDSGRATVMTAIEVPREFLESIEDARPVSFLHDGQDLSSSDEEVAKYLDERGRRLVEPVISALRARGTNPETLFVEGQDPSETITRTALKVEADLIVMGATRKLFSGDAWKSVSARIMLESQLPVLLVPGPKIEDTAEIPRVEL